MSNPTLRIEKTAYKPKWLRGKPAKASKRPKVKRKEKSVSKLMRELDQVFSRFIRGFAAKEGICQCYTCGHFAPVSKIQAGHYISRFYKATRWDENNVRPQCMMCNLWKRGDAPTFRENLIKEIGQEKVVEIEEKRKLSLKLDRDWLMAEIARYQAKLSIT